MSKYKREVLKRLTRIERALEEVVELLEAKVRETPAHDERASMAADKWLQEGIDQIMAFQPGKVRVKEE